MIKKIRYALEAVILYAFYGLFSVLPPATASNIGGWLGRTIGPRLAASRKAYRNLQEALPKLGPEQQKTVITEMWDNLGRVIAEYPHLEILSREHTELEGAEMAEQARDSDEGAIFFAAHMANWEVFAPTVLNQCGMVLDLTYRALNNPWSDRLLERARSLNGQIRVYPKSRSGGKDTLGALKEGRNIGILIDQKYNEGISVPFFGRPAMTNPAFVQLCQKYKCPLIPANIRRVDGARFHMVLYEPLELFRQDGQPRPVEDVIAEAHTLLEGWIRDNPGQWLWLHRRWG